MNGAYIESMVRIESTVLNVYHSDLNNQAANDKHLSLKGIRPQLHDPSLYFKIQDEDVCSVAQMFKCEFVIFSFGIRFFNLWGYVGGYGSVVSAV